MLIPLSVAALFWALGSAVAEAWQIPEDVNEVADRLLGAYDSATQAIEDRNYEDVRITHCHVTLVSEPEPTPNNLTRWEKATAGARFLYLEQASSLAAGAPYRQRFIRITPGLEAGQVTSTVYLPGLDLQQLVGFCNRSIEERLVTPATLGLAQCAVVMTKQNNLWVGQTPPNTCPGEFRDSAYTTTEVSLGEDYMESWDRGWSDAGIQVWGPLTGPYRFTRIRADSRDTEINGIAQRLIGEFNNSQQLEDDPTHSTSTRFSNCAVSLTGESEKSLVLLANETRGDRTISSLFALQRSDYGRIHLQMFPYQGEEDGLDICRIPRQQRPILNISIGENPICVLAFRPEHAVFSGVSISTCPSLWDDTIRVRTTLSAAPWFFDWDEEPLDSSGHPYPGPARIPHRLELF